MKCPNRQIYRDRKQISGSKGPEEGTWGREQWERWLTAKRVSFQGDEEVLWDQIVMIVPYLVNILKIAEMYILKE